MIAIEKPVPMTLIGGFLGAGKTSLLRHILSADHGKRIAVLVNDFGKINIDAELIVNIDGETVSLTNGCICCTIRDDLMVEVLRLLASETRPEHIIVETSGVSDPTLVAHTFLMPAMQGLVEVDGIISVVDADQVLSLDEKFRDLAERQIRIADLLVINKIDLVNETQREQVRGYARKIAPDARILESTHGRAPLDLLLGIEATGSGRIENREESPEQGDHAIFETCAYTSKRPFTCIAIRKALEELPAGIYRAKGFFYVDSSSNDHGVFQMTGGRAWLRLGEKWEAGQEALTRIVFIGTPAAVDPDTIANLFDRCQARYSQTALEIAPEPVMISDLRALSVVFS